ncbi:MAG: prephenate dehydrogenase, partial [Parcubacteria group bacterium Gr01-1014_91]
IGIKGRFGQWLQTFLSRQGFTVIGSDIGTHITNIDVVRRADVVIFAVRLSRMASVIGSLVPYSRKSQLWLDIGSLKKEILQKMLRSRAEVAGMHPLFAPPHEMSWKSETLVLSTTRLKRWSKWFGKFIATTGATVVRATPDMHDSMMVFTQNLPQATVLALAMTFADLVKSPPSNLLKFSTTASRKVLALIASMLANTPEVYGDIQVGNREGVAALDALIDSLKLIRKLASEGSSDEIALILGSLRSLYGEEFIAAGKNGFVR